jgi:FkbM family methyltransferase
MDSSIVFVNGYACLNDGVHANWIKEVGRLDHDWWLFKHLDQYVKEGDVIIDAGAHIGTHTIWYSNRVGYSGRVLAFEANRAAFECLSINCGGMKNVELHYQALGDKEGEVSIEVIPDNAGMSYVREGVGVRMNTIDSLGLDRLDFIKIDVEGFEPNVLEGAAETISRCRPVMFIEVNREALKRNGYTPEDVYKKLFNLRYSFKNLYDTEDLSGDQFDIIAFHEESNH